MTLLYFLGIIFSFFSIFSMEQKEENIEKIKNALVLNDVVIERSTGDNGYRYLTKLGENFDTQEDFFKKVKKWQRGMLDINNDRNQLLDQPNQEEGMSGLDIFSVHDYGNDTELLRAILKYRRIFILSCPETVEQGFEESDLLDLDLKRKFFLEFRNSKNETIKGIVTILGKYFTLADKEDALNIEFQKTWQKSDVVELVSKNSSIFALTKNFCDLIKNLQKECLKEKTHECNDDFFQKNQLAMFDVITKYKSLEKDFSASREKIRKKLEEVAQQDFQSSLNVKDSLNAEKKQVKKTLLKQEVKSEPEVESKEEIIAQEIPSRGEVPGFLMEASNEQGNCKVQIFEIEENKNTKLSSLKISYTQNVLEWKKSPEEAWKNQGYCAIGNKKLSSPEDKEKVIAVHGFPDEVDKYVFTHGKMSLIPDRKNEGKVVVQITLPGTMEFEGDLKHGVFRFIFQLNSTKKLVTLEEVRANPSLIGRCFHRNFENVPVGKMISNFLEKGYFDVDFPPLKSTK